MDDVLNPALEEIDGAMYRMNIVDVPNSHKDMKVYLEDELECIPCDYEDFCDRTEDPFTQVELNFEVLHRADFQFQIRFHVPKQLHGRLIGTRGTTKQRLERETNTRIIIPKMHQKGDIVVMGRSKRDVAASYSRIQILVESGRRAIPFTHFLSIPLNMPNIRERYEVFKNEVINLCRDDQEIIKSGKLFTPTGRLHLTLGVLTLLDDEARKNASNLLEKCYEHVIKPLVGNESIAVQVKGLDIMNDDPSRTRVLYARVQTTNNILQLLIDDVVNFYSRSGLMKKEIRNNVKVHMTLMKSEPLESENEGNDVKNRKKKYPTFDATKIMQNFKGFNFGETTINSIHLSQRFVYSEDDYYLPSYKIAWN